MSPKPFTENSTREYSTTEHETRPCGCDFPNSPECECDTTCAHCWPDFQNFHLHRRVGNTIICSAAIIALVAAIALLYPGLAQGHAPRPVPAPQSLLKARAACPENKPLACRAALRRAYDAVAWQRHARFARAAGKSTDVVRDAIQWASHQTGVAAWRMIRIGQCESHLFWLARTGQYWGWAQLGAMHRSDPIFRIVPWQDPYAQAIHMARFIKAHGSGQWQCSEYGGLRW